MRLSDYAVGRDNNFTLLRFSAAMTVLFAHSVAVLGLPPEREFFFNRLGFRKCATLIGGVRYSLPGVFETVPLKGEFNDALSAARPIRGVASNADRPALTK